MGLLRKTISLNHPHKMDDQTKTIPNPKRKKPYTIRRIRKKKSRGT